MAESDDESSRVSGALNDALSFRDWLNQYTTNPRIHGLFQSMIASLLTVNSWELPAAEYFKAMRNIAPLRFGYVEGGSLKLWERMANFVRSRGGDVVTSSAATAIASSSGRVTGVTLRMHGRDVHVEAPVVISNVGDASCPRGFAGSMGAATSAMLVRDDLRKTG